MKRTTKTIGKSNQPTTIFLHIPKTAGITLNRILNLQYTGSHIFTIGGKKERNEFYQLNKRTRSKYRLIRGHMEYGIHSLLPNPVSYFTILREPVNRVISYYYFLKTRKNDPMHSKAKQLDLPTYIESNLDPLVDNFQTRMLAGMWYSIPVGELPTSALDIAKQRLQESFTVVGLTEKFDESLILLQQAYHYKWLYYTRHNIGANKPRRTSLSQSTIDAVKEANQLDIKLYAEARELFDEQIKRSGEHFQKKVTKFQQTNKRLQPILKTYWAVRRVSFRQILRPRI